ncbi:EAP30/Vps36 family-domain-containing protein [Limtongia smithiae]|uniref:EAP30/Vps36 family-domain-containing protein n=1 Tax=Limtongia smithiae TaxID=1125753 RepID=UPI0034CDB34B
MLFWTQIDLTSARRPVLLPHEVDIYVQDGVGLYEGQYKIDGYQHGRIYLTTHRVCYVDNARAATHSVAIELAHVTRVQFSPGFLRSSPKIALYFSPVRHGIVSHSAPATPQPATNTIERNTTLTWICPICSFSNAIKLNDAEHAPPSPCLTCGIRPPASLIKDAIVSYQSEQHVSHSYPKPLPVDVKVADGFPCPRCTFVNHPSLHYCEMCGANLVSSSVPPALLDEVMRDLVLDGRSSPGPVHKSTDNVEEITCVKISFRSGGDKVFLEKLKFVLQEREWASAKHKDRAHTGSIPTDASKHSYRYRPQSNEYTPKFGIHGLQRQGARNREHTIELMTSLSDLESLMSKAKEMVGLAESFASRLSNAPGVPEEARKALLQSSEALSLSSPIVTREMAGAGTANTFYAELARQLAEFLDNGVLSREGGILTLFDLYALYNRARGIDLISPKDFSHACGMFESLRLPFRLRKFRSGVIVIQEAYYSDETVCKMIIGFIRQKETLQDIRSHKVGVTAQDLNQQFGWSVMVAVGELQTAELSGKLCSDLSIEGARFYENLFAGYEWNWRTEVFGD